MARPIYYGMLLFAQAGAGQLVETTVDRREQAPLLTVYGLRGSSGAIKVAAFNKHSDRSLRLAIDAGRRAGRVTAHAIACAARG